MSFKGWVYKEDIDLLCTTFNAKLNDVVCMPCTSMKSDSIGNITGVTVRLNVNTDILDDLEKKDLKWMLQR